MVDLPRFQYWNGLDFCMYISKYTDISNDTSADDKLTNVGDLNGAGGEYLKTPSRI